MIDENTFRNLVLRALWMIILFLWSPRTRMDGDEVDDLLNEIDKEASK